MNSDSTKTSCGAGVTARIRANRRALENPGDLCYTVSKNSPNGGFDGMILLCPGCGEASAIKVHSMGLAGDGWECNTNPDNPTLYPSIQHTCGWHGWLRDGVFQSV